MPETLRLAATRESSQGCGPSGSVEGDVVLRCVGLLLLALHDISYLRYSLGISGVGEVFADVEIFIRASTYHQMEDLLEVACCFRRICVARAEKVTDRHRIS